MSDLIRVLTKVRILRPDAPTLRSAIFLLLKGMANQPSRILMGVIPIWRRFCAANSILQIMLRAHLARPLFGCHLRILVASIGRRGSGAVPWRSMLYRSVRI